MKIKLLITLLAMNFLHGCSILDKPESELEKMNLNGDVKSIREIYFETEDKFGELTKGKRMKLASVYEQHTYFNEAGNINKIEYYELQSKLNLQCKCNFDLTGKEEFKREYPSGLDRIITISHYSPSDMECYDSEKNKVLHTTYKLNEDGAKTEEYNYNHLGEFIGKSTFLYDKWKNIIEERQYNKKGKTILKYVRENHKGFYYDKMGILTKIEHYDTEINTNEALIYDNKGIFLGKTLFKYASDNKLIENRVYDKDGQLSRVKKYHYYPPVKSSNNWLDDFPFVAKYYLGYGLFIESDYLYNLELSLSECYSYGDNNLPISKKTYGPTQELIEYTFYNYDDNDLLIEEKVLDINQVLMRISLFSYNPEGILLEETNFDANNILISKIKYQFSDSEQTVSIRSFNNQGNQISYVDYSITDFKLTYYPLSRSLEIIQTEETVFDEKNNWIEQVVTTKDNSKYIVEREIVYYGSSVHTNEVGNTKSDSLISTANNKPYFKEEFLENGVISACYDYQYDKTIENYLKINVGNGTDVVLKIINLESDICIRYVYVKSNSTHTVNDIPHGKYYLKIAYGKNWMVQKEKGVCSGKFGNNPIYERGTDILDYNLIKSTDGYSVPSYELSLDVISSTPANSFNSANITEKEFYE